MEASSNSSIEIQAEGNTNPSARKQISPAIRWCFTLNNYTIDDISSVSSIIEGNCRFGIVGVEVGESGTPHLQGYLEFKSKRRPMSIFYYTRDIHWEIARGTKEQNIAYCSKDDPDPFIFPKPHKKKPILIETMYDWEQRIIDIIKCEASNRMIYWFWSKKGGAGKSTFQKWLYRNYDNTIVLSGKAHDCKNALVQYVSENKRGPEICLINIPKAQSLIDYETFECIKDMFFYSGKYEGGMVDEDPCHLFVFANMPPDKEKMTERFVVENIDMEGESEEEGGEDIF